MTGMDFKGASGKVRQLLAPKRPKDLSKSALTEDQLRDNIIGEAAERSERWQAASNKAPELTYTDEQGNEQTHSWDEYPEAMRDYARAAFGWEEPKTRPRDQVAPSHRLNREVIEAMLHSDAFQDSRPYTRNRELESLYGAMAAGESLAESASGVLAEHIKLSNEIGDAEQDAQDAEDMFESLRNRARQEISDVGEVQPGTKREIKRALKKIDATLDALGQLMQQQLTGGMIVDAIAAGAAAAEAGAEAAEMVSSLPGVDAGQAQKLSVDQQIKLAEKWKDNPAMREIARLVGRMLRSFRFRRNARTKNVRIEPVGVTTGNDLELLLPHEAARGFSDNKLIKTTFMKDFAERSLLQYQMIGKAPAGKGAIVCAWDGSGSMAGEKFVWASSIALTMLTTAQREKRAFCGIEFGSRSEMMSWLFPKGQSADPERVLEMTAHFFGGGTDITLGMAEALRVLKDEDAFKMADIVLISDGQDRFAEDDLRIRSQLQELGVRIHGISILAPGNAYLNQMCDYTVDVADLVNNQALDKLAENLH